MGIFSEKIVTTDALGRRAGLRKRHAIEDRLRIVEEARAKVALVAMVTRSYHVNTAATIHAA